MTRATRVEPACRGGIFCEEHCPVHHADHVTRPVSDDEVASAQRQYAIGYQAGRDSVRTSKATEVEAGPVRSFLTPEVPEAGWAVTVERAPDECGVCFATVFSVGVQHFKLASSRDPDEGREHCEFIRNAFLAALDARDALRSAKATRVSDHLDFVRSVAKRCVGCNRWEGSFAVQRFVGCEPYRSDDPGEWCIGCEAQAILEGLLRLEGAQNKTSAVETTGTEAGPITVVDSSGPIAGGSVEVPASTSAATHLEGAQPCQFPGCHGGGSAHIESCPNACVVCGSTKGPFGVDGSCCDAPACINRREGR